MFNYKNILNVYLSSKELNNFENIHTTIKCEFYFFLGFTIY